jgi:transposase-like protein
MRKTKKGREFSIEEKNQIVLLYLDNHVGMSQIKREYQVASISMIQRWVKQYKEFGTCVDRRGKATKKDNPKIGRPKKYKVNLEDLSKEQLIEKVRMYEDIKKSMAYLINQQQN